MFTEVGRSSIERANEEVLAMIMPVTVTFFPLKFSTSSADRIASFL